MDYRHTQTGLTAFFVSLVLAVVLVVVLSAGEEWIVIFATGFGLLVVWATVVAFSRLTVAVGDGAITVSFGWGWPRRTIAIGDVDDVRAVRNRWFHGWGIRKVHGGWMFNVWGLDAVELALKPGKRFRIGTDEPADLVAAVALHRSLRRDGV